MSIDQPRHVRRLQPRDAGVDQARLLAAGDDLDRPAERRPARAARKSSRLLASRRVCVATARTWLGAKPSSRPAKRARQSSPRVAGLFGRAGRRRRGRRRGARSPSGSRCAGSGRRRAAPISSRKLFEPMSIAASWPGQRRSRVRRRGAVSNPSRRLCGSAMRAPPIRGAFLECSPCRPPPRNPRCCAPTSILCPRDFVRSRRAAASPRAVLPVARDGDQRPTARASTAGEVTIGRRLPMPAYRAAPAGGERLPVVLVVSEIFGVHEHIADVARRFARLGYLAIAPELFVRQGDAKAVGEIAKLFATDRLQGARRAGDGRPRRHRRLGRGPGRRHRPARRHRLLLGRAHDLALRRPQPGGARRRRLVRPADRRRPTSGRRRIRSSSRRA